MLVDRLNEQNLDFTYPDGYRHETALAPFKERLAAASVYILDANAVAMACNVAYSKPSSIIAALPWVRLPFKSVFIEFANSHLREASAAIGSPNVRPPNTRTHLVRSGFLVTESDGELTMEYLSEQTSPDNRTLIDLAPVRATFTVSGAELPEPSAHVSGSVPPTARGKVRDHIKLITTDPYEYASYLNLHARFTWMPHPDMTRVATSMRRMQGQAAVDTIYEDQANEMYRLFVGAILPALILINCRNAVAIEHVPAPDKLNKARARKGKPPIREHHEIHLNLSSARRRAMQVGQNGSRIPVASLVAGHFKVRKTGVFYWNAHTRLGGGEGLAKVHRVTA